MKKLLKKFIIKFTLQTPSLIKNIETKSNILENALEKQIISNLNNDSNENM